MSINFDEVRANARLLLAADKWHGLTQLLEKDVPLLLDELERLRRELTEAKRSEKSLPFTHPMVPQHPKEGAQSEFLTARQFGELLGITEACVRRWMFERKIKVVKLGRLVRIPRTEIQRLIGEGTIPARNAQGRF